VDDVHRLIVDQVPYLRRYAIALLRDRDAADDLVQDCLARAIDRLHLWKPGSNMRSWLFSILHNLYVNSARRGARRPDRFEIETGHEGLHAVPPNQSDRHEVRDLVRALAQLSEEQQQTILLVGLEGLSYAEAADVLDIPIGTVMSRLNRGRQRLRQIIEQGEAVTLSVVK
jgi:RNA polymerase sigma-70 factor (ECF subfamily)